MSKYTFRYRLSNIDLERDYVGDFINGVIVTIKTKNYDNAVKSLSKVIQKIYDVENIKKTDPKAKESFYLINYES